jgi:hypothetical protein
MGFLQFVQAQLGADPRRAARRLLAEAEVGDADPLLGADDAGPFDDVAQLADIARPGVVQQRGAGLVGEAAGRAGVLLDEAGEEALGQVEDVLTALAQRR